MSIQYKNQLQYFCSTPLFINTSYTNICFLQFSPFYFYFDGNIKDITHRFDCIQIRRAVGTRFTHVRLEKCPNLFQSSLRAEFWARVWRLKNAEHILIVNYRRSNKKAWGLLMKPENADVNVSMHAHTHHNQAYRIYQGK